MSCVHPTASPRFSRNTFLIPATPRAGPSRLGLGSPTAQQPTSTQLEGAQAWPVQISKPLTYARQSVPAVSMPQVATSSECCCHLDVAVHSSRSFGSLAARACLAAAVHWHWALPVTLAEPQSLRSHCCPEPLHIRPHFPVTAASAAVARQHPQQPPMPVPPQLR